MSKIFKESNHSITRDLKIDESAKNNYTMSEIPLNSVTKKFLKEPLTLETFDKKFRQMYDDNNKKEPEVEEPPKKKTKRKEGKAIFYDIFIKPKEQKIKEIIDKRSQKTKAAVTTKPIDKNYISHHIEMYLLRNKSEILHNFGLFPLLILYFCNKNKYIEK